MYTDEAILKELQRVASKLNKKSLSIAEFKKHGQISDATIINRFALWNVAVEKAGLDPIDPIERARSTPSIPEEDLLLDLIRLYKEFGKTPTKALINSEGKYSDHPYRKKFGGHIKAFRLAQKKYPEKFQQQSAITETPLTTSSSAIKLVPKTIKPREQRSRRIVFGEPIDFRGLRFAPINEQGVVYLFGMISHELGYLIESIRTEFPDCEGKRCFDQKNNRWEQVRIEFEYKSSNFREHGHNEHDCDVIVCWIHDWDECPIEVLELKSTINYL